MQRITAGLLLLILVFGCVATFAQEPTSPPPKVLVIIREFTKPGKGGSAHMKTESAFVNAFNAAKWPQHYLAADGVSGMPRSIFFVGYESFAAWEKDTAATNNNASLSAALDRATLADGEMLSSSETSTFVYREDQSYHSAVDIAQMRYFEITRFHVRPGHEKEWDDVVKIYVDNFGKAVPDAHWAVYQDMYGRDSGGTYLVITPMKSLSEIDKGFANSKKFAEQMGEAGMKKLSDLAAASIDSTESNILAFNPRLSYPPDAWVKADPEFWKPKPMAPAKAPAKPAQ